MLGNVLPVDFNGTFKIKFNERKYHFFLVKVIAKKLIGQILKLGNLTNISVTIFRILKLSI